ncbi:conserved protein of unknown function [Bradyrhizobium sp. ORS 285]|nr:DUF2066 domain-containing protein [Bradyrhizobium sp. ORS 285]CCD86425.1 conserved hypothetical protein [Bradyrhizobium sp. ORS 285]SMX58813.1 conserved protein of unknown function [Bradyrhizobium sp. ORS 285]
MRLRNVRRAWSALWVGLWLVTTGDAVRADNDLLYQAQTVVTGQGDDNRRVGFAACLEDVLIKVSGAFQLKDDGRLAPLKTRAGDFVTAFDYHDQMSGKPKRDEQGTRDRPYDLTVTFDRGKIDGLLQTLNVRPWLMPRPSIAVIVAMSSGSRTFLVTSDDKQSDLQRDALRAAASKRGLDVVLPDASQAGPVAIGSADLPPATLAASLRGAEVTLLGRLTWDDSDLGWVSQWELDAAGAKHRWQFRGVTFDEAFRRGLGGVAQILSGNGAP